MIIYNCCVIWYSSYNCRGMETLSIKDLVDSFFGYLPYYYQRDIYYIYVFMREYLYLSNYIIGRHKGWDFILKACVVLPLA